MTNRLATFTAIKVNSERLQVSPLILFMRYHIDYTVYLNTYNVHCKLIIGAHSVRVVQFYFNVITYYDEFYEE